MDDRRLDDWMHWQASRGGRFAWMVLTPARIVVGISGVPEPRAEVLSLRSDGMPAPFRSKRTIVSAARLETSARHMSYS